METAISINKEQWIEKFAKVGYMAKGVVYSLIGILALIAAFGKGNTKSAGKENVMKVILEQPFGKILLAIVALGLLGYVIWRFFEAIKDPEHHGKKPKGILIRIGYVISAFIYLSLSIYAFKLVITNVASSGNKKEALLSQLMETTAGQWAIAIVALILVGKGIQQIYKSISGSYRKDIETSRMYTKYKDLLVKTGAVGYVARGITLGIVGILLLRAALYKNPQESGDTGEALSFIDQSFGTWVLGLVALGLICYGIFKILEGLYRKISLN